MSHQSIRYVQKNLNEFVKRSVTKKLIAKIILLGLTAKFIRQA